MSHAWYSDFFASDRQTSQCNAPSFQQLIRQPFLLTGQIRMSKASVWGPTCHTAAFGPQIPQTVYLKGWCTALFWFKKWLIWIPNPNKEWVQPDISVQSVQLDVCPTGYCSWSAQERLVPPGSCNLNTKKVNMQDCVCSTIMNSKQNAKMLFESTKLKIYAIMLPQKETKAQMRHIKIGAEALRILV